MTNFLRLILNVTPDTKNFRIQKGRLVLRIKNSHLPLYPSSRVGSPSTLTVPRSRYGFVSPTNPVLKPGSSHDHPSSPVHFTRLLPSPVLSPTSGRSIVGWGRVEGQGSLGPVLCKFPIRTDFPGSPSIPDRVFLSLLLIHRGIFD